MTTASSPSGAVQGKSAPPERLPKKTKGRRRNYRSNGERSRGGVRDRGGSVVKAPDLSQFFFALKFP